MREKLSVEQFREQRAIINDYYQQMNAEYEAHKDDKDFDIEQLERKFIGRLLELQSHLLSYDLSDIPFEEWNGFEVFSDKDHVVDFSGTKANIDFKIINFYGFGIFKGCNIRNLESIANYLHDESFDEEVIAAHPDLFISDIFSREFKDKYYSRSLELEDLVSLTEEQIKELVAKNINNHHIRYELRIGCILEQLGLEFVIKLYNYSKEDFGIVNEMINKYRYYIDFTGEYTFEILIDRIKTADVSAVKQICFDFYRNAIISSFSSVPNDLPQEFIDANPDLYLIDVELPEEVRERFLNKHLTIQDILMYPDVLLKVPIDSFFGQLDSCRYISDFYLKNYGPGVFQQLVTKYHDVFQFLSEDSRLYSFARFLVQGKDYESSFINSIKKFYQSHYKLETNGYDENGRQLYFVPDWLKSVGFVVLDKITTPEELLGYNERTMIASYEQEDLIERLGIENILRMEKEIGLFTHEFPGHNSKILMFEAFCGYFRMNNYSKDGIYSIFNGEKMSYEEFLDKLAICLDRMRAHNLFTDYPNYDWIEGPFRDSHPETFISKDAPEEVKRAFYRNALTIGFILEHRECIPFLLDKNLFECLSIDKIGLCLNDNLKDKENCLDFVKEYCERYGNEKFLNLILKYGTILDGLVIDGSNNVIDDEVLLDKAIKKAIHDRIVENNPTYSYLSNVLDFVAAYPDLFIDLNNVSSILEEDKKAIIEGFYAGNLGFETIRKYPELVEILKDKNLERVFKRRPQKRRSDGLNEYGLFSLSNDDVNLVSLVGNEDFLKLCSVFGRYLYNTYDLIKKRLIVKDDALYTLMNGVEIELTYEELVRMVEEIITIECMNGNVMYLPDDAPDFLRERHPELFLDADAPEELKKCFYSSYRGYVLTFEYLHRHKEWMPYLQGKSIVTALLKNRNIKVELLKFFQLFGQEKAIKLGISRAETVTKMLEQHKVDIMKSWYDKTGGKFIPDVVVMENFSLDDADKFLAAGNSWSTLMRIKNFAQKPESRDAMLKLAYSFGVFDQDQRGFKKLIDLLTGLPRKIPANHGYVIDRIDEQIDIYSQRGMFFKETAIIEGHGKVTYEHEEMTPEEKERAYEQMLEYAKKTKFVDCIDQDALIGLLVALKEEKFNIDFSKPLMAQLYKKNEDGSYSLTFNEQSYPKTARAVRTCLEFFSILPIISPDKAHQLFGGFVLKYDPEFREFLLANMDAILTTPEYTKYVASIQKHFEQIKIANSNRVLTWDLAISYVQSNKYEFVGVGNERVAEIASIAGYSQGDFDTLQLIYSYGKQRTFSSIPRIERTKGRYNYEILRLDDPLAMAIGTLTDCCQEINDCAEMCMEHSMVDKNGRVFIIKDEEGNIIAQSWVWRNKDVLCFDNIEIPNKAFERAEKLHPSNGRQQLADEVFTIYQQAAKELIEEDERVYRGLLENGLITQEQYVGLRLGKVTVGTGYNDIASSLKRNAELDRGTVARPLPFEPPVRLNRSLYTSDSRTQYVLAEREDRKEYEGETLRVHNDSFVEHTDKDFNLRMLLTLNKLEIVTKGESRYLDTTVNTDGENEHLIVTGLAKSYDLNPENTRVVMNPNFAIIYEVKGNSIKIADLLFNTMVEGEVNEMNIENVVAMQIRLALEQIVGDKEVDISDLSDKQKEMYEKALGLNDEFTEERGVGRAR